MQKEQIVLKCYDLLKEMIPVLSKFPRDQKFLVGDRIQNIISDVMETLIEAYYINAEEKKAKLLSVNVEIEKLRYYIRLCYDSGYFNSFKYKEIIEKINEIGRMAGGWIKSLK